MTERRRGVDISGGQPGRRQADGRLDVGFIGVSTNLTGSIFLRGNGLHSQRLWRGIIDLRSVGGVLVAAWLGNGRDLINDAGRRRD